MDRMHHTCSPQPLLSSSQLFTEPSRSVLLPVPFSRPSSGRQAGSSNTVSSVTGQSMVCWMDEGCWVNEGHRVGQEVHNGDKLNHARGCKTSQQATPLKVIRQQATLLCQKIIHHVSEGVFHLHPKNLNRMAWDRWHALLCPSF